MAESFVTDAYYAFVAGRRRWAAWRAPALAPSAARPGTRAKVIGRAEPVETVLQAAYSGRPCVFFEVVERQIDLSRGLAGMDRSVEIAREASTAPFYLVGDDGSRLLVEPTIAVHTFDAEAMPAAEEHQRREARIHPGDRLTVYGMVDEAGAVVRGEYRAAPSTIPRLRGTESEPLVLSPAR